MDKDIITKEAIESITKDIAFYILHLNISDEIEFINKELKRIEKREADIVAKCMIDGKEAIFHLEIQNSNDKNMPYRMLRYYIDIRQKYPKLPIYQYLLYTSNKKLSMKNYISENNLNFNYKLIDMREIDCEEFIKIDTPDSLVLAVLCDFKDKNEKDVLFYLTKRLQELLRNNSDKLSKYMLMLETLSKNRDLKETLKEVESMLREIEFEKLPSYELGLERGVQDGMQLGLKKGLEKGLEKGREEEKLSSALIMINDFNLPPKEVANKIDLPLEVILKYMEKK